MGVHPHAWCHDRLRYACITPLKAENTRLAWREHEALQGCCVKPCLRALRQRSQASRVYCIYELVTSCGNIIASFKRRNGSSK